MVKKSGEKSDGGDGSLGSVAPFLKKCFEMVDDEATDAIISWRDNGDCFVIWDMTHFSVHLLPKYFKHNNFSSFMRQLNIYVSFSFLLIFFVIHFHWKVLFLLNYWVFWVFLFLFFFCYVAIAYLNFDCGGFEFL